MHFLRQRLIQLVIVLFAVTLLTFTLLRLLPGDPAIAIAGIGASPAKIEETRHKWGLDEPIPVQYVKWVGKTLTGDLGLSSAFNVKVSTLVSERLPVTLWLMFYAMFFSLLIAVPLGIWTAYRANRPADRVISTVSFGLLSLPPYILGVLFVYVFALRLGWFPALSHYVSPFEDPAEHFKSMFLPALTLALGLVAVFQRLLRADM